MDELERQRASREARAQSARIVTAHGFSVLRYLAAEAYVTQLEDKDKTPSPTPHGSEQPR